MLKLRTLTISLLLVFVFGAPSLWATSSRLNSMGGGTKSITVEDESNVFFFPSSLVDHGNIAFVDDLNRSRGGFGLHYALTKNTIFAVYGGNNRQFGWNVRRGGGPDPAEGGGNKSLWGSTDFKGAFGLGIDFKPVKWGIMMSLFSADPKVAGEWGDEGLWGPMFGVDLVTGIGLTFGKNKLDLALGLEYGSVGFEDVPGASGNEDQTDSHLGIKLGARMAISVAPGVHAIPYMTLRYVSDTVESFGNTNAVLQAGADLRISPVKDVFIYPGVGLRYGTFTPEGGKARTQVAIPTVSLAVDARITDWLDWRLGAVHLDISESCGSDSTETCGGTLGPDEILRDQKLRFSTGFGLHFGEWTIDMNLDPQLFTEGVYFLTGTEQSWAVDAALLYRW